VLYESLTGALLVLASLIALSLVYIIIIALTAKRELKKFKTMHREPEIEAFWLERWIGKGFLGYALVATILPLAAILIDYFMTLLITGSVSWWWAVGRSLVYTACVFGFFLVRKVYNVYRSEALPEMLKKLQGAKNEEDISFGLKMFGIVAGSKPVYSIINLGVTVVFFLLVNYFIIIPDAQRLAGINNGIDLRLIAANWLSLMFCIVIIGMVGPMATVMSGFIMYCAWKFRDDEKLYDAYHPDKCGGFKSLGTLGMWESFMAAAAPWNWRASHVFNIQTTNIDREYDKYRIHSVFNFLCIGFLFCTVNLFTRNHEAISQNQFTGYSK